MRVDILLATFNGDKYLQDQIESILAQTYNDWRLVMHDDGSTDKTKDILRIYSKKYKEKILYLDDDVVTGSAKDNFYYLLGYVLSDYVMFCDQDDVWMESKIDRMMRCMRDIESEFDGPILIHTDLQVVDHDLGLIASSMKNRQLHTHVNTLDNLLLGNYVTGCTVLFNRKLLDKATTPKLSVMHDWWFAIETLRNSGVLYYMDEATVLYRQHEGNVVGAKSLSRIYLNKLLSPVMSVRLLKAQYVQYNHVKPIGLISFLFKKVLRVMKYKWI